MNPYAAQLGTRDPLEVMAQTPATLAALLHRMGPSRADQPLAPGKWSPRQIACHLADCEIVFAYRLRQALAQDNHQIQPFDQDDWAKPYAAYDLAAALALFTALRAWNLTLAGTLSAPALEKAVTHPERGTMPYRDLLATIAGHDINHLAQLEARAVSPSSRCDSESVPT